MTSVGSLNTMKMTTPAMEKPAGIHFPCLSIALTIMMVGSIYPLMFARADGSAHHGFAIAIFWTMSTGFVRGVGFVPIARIWRLLFSGWSCFSGLALAAWLHQGV